MYSIEQIIKANRNKTSVTFSDLYVEPYEEFECGEFFLNYTFDDNGRNKWELNIPISELSAMYSRQQIGAIYGNAFIITKREYLALKKKWNKENYEKVIIKIN